MTPCPDCGKPQTDIHTCSPQVSNTEQRESREDEALTREKQVLGAFLAAMHDGKLDGAAMRKAMEEILGIETMLARERQFGEEMGYRQGQASARRALVADLAAARAEVAALKNGLRYYAEKSHFGISDSSAWDTVSGEPPNLWCDEAGTATIEDGTVARLVLEGHALPWDDEPAAEAKRNEVATPAGDATSCLSWNGFNLHGDVKSIQEAQRLRHEADRAEQLAEILISERNQRATPTKSDAMVAAPSLADITGAVARGWCSKENAHKEMDSTLALAIADEVAAMLAANQETK